MQLQVLVRKIRIDPLRFLAGCHTVSFIHSFIKTYTGPDLLYWTRLTLLNGFSFLVNFFFLFNCQLSSAR